MIFYPVDSVICQMVPGKKLLNESGGFHYFLDHIYYTVELTVIKVEISPLCTTKIP